MKNYRINPNEISDLVSLTNSFYDVLQKQTKYSPHKGEKATQMHFVADLLKDLVDTAYPTEKSNDKYSPANDAIDALIYALDLKPINESVLKDIEKDFQNIAKMMKDYKPPKAGEF